MSDFEISVGSEGNVTVEILQPKNNGVAYALGVWDKSSKSWAFGPAAGFALPNDDEPDIFDIGPAKALHGQLLCISGKLIGLPDMPTKYALIFEVDSDSGATTRQSATYEESLQVDLVYRLTA